MPNLISVTGHGSNQDVQNALDIIRAPAIGLRKIAPEPVRRFAGDAMAVARDLRAVQSANPLAYIVNDLAFPDAVADGTLKGKPGFE